VIRATVVSTIDQACLSALSFGIAFALIHFATKEQYGLYAQLTNLQSFFSPINAGVFISAYLAIASKLVGDERTEFRAAMARAEFVVSVASAVFVIGLCSFCSPLFGYRLTFGTCMAFGLALLGLWWREFGRIVQFTDFRFASALRMDIVYCLVTSIVMVLMAVICGLTVTVTLWSMGLGALAASIFPLFGQNRSARPDLPSIGKHLTVSWDIGKWDVLGSIVTWGYQQSYIYFAAGMGGLSAAAEIAAARLLVTPLALLWASFANVLRPKASHLFAVGTSKEICSLAKHSSVFVLSTSIAYLILLLALLPAMEKTVFGGKFHHLTLLVTWWTIYIALTGQSTIASSILRSALEFRQVFNRQLVSCIAAVGLLSAGSRFGPIESIVIVLVAIEAVSAGLLWHRLNKVLSRAKLSRLGGS